MSNNSITAEQLVEKLDLKPHPEGGFYSRIFESVARLESSKDRPMSTGIYYLLTHGAFSRLHKLKSSDEVWHFYTGVPLTVITLDPISGEAKKTKLGSDIFNGQTFNYTVPAGVWFGACLETSKPGDFALVGCNVTPGFMFEEFEMGNRNQLLKEFPKAIETINKLTLPTNDIFSNNSFERTTN